MKRCANVRIFLLLGLMGGFSGLNAQNGNWSIDLIGGSPIVISNVTNAASPMVGAGVRYSLTPSISAQLQVNGGVFSGYSDATGTYFSNNFLQYSVRLMANLSNMFARANSVTRLNAYLYAGAGNVKCYKRQSQASDISALERYNSLFYVPVAGLQLRYYLNEHIDLVAGADMNFTETRILDNTPGGEYDRYATTYAGLSFKLSSGMRKKQAPDWSRISLPYDAYTAELRKAQLEAQNASAEVLAAKRETERVKSEVAFAQAEIVSLRALNEMLAMRNQIDTMQAGLTQLKAAVTPAPAPMPGQYALATRTRDSKAEPAPAVPAKLPDAGMVKPVDQSQRYAIVVGSFVHSGNAWNEKKKLSDKGYQVEVVHFNDPGVQRLVIYSDSLREAEVRLSEIRVRENQEAWLLSIR